MTIVEENMRALANRVDDCIEVAVAVDVGKHGARATKVWTSKP